MDMAGSRRQCAISTRYSKSVLTPPQANTTTDVCCEGWRGLRGRAAFGVAGGGQSTVKKVVLHCDAPSRALESSPRMLRGGVGVIFRAPP